MAFLQPRSRRRLQCFRNLLRPYFTGAQCTLHIALPLLGILRANEVQISNWFPVHTVILDVVPNLGYRRKGSLAEGLMFPDLVKHFDWAVDIRVWSNVEDVG